MNCDNCGNEIPENAEFCEFCANAAASKPPRKKKRAYFYVPLIIAAVVCITLIVVFADGRLTGVNKPSSESGDSASASPAFMAETSPAADVQTAAATAPIISTAAPTTVAAMTASTTAAQTASKAPETTTFDFLAEFYSSNKPEFELKTNFPKTEIKVLSQRTDIANPADFYYQAMAKLNNANVIELNNTINAKIDYPEFLDMEDTELKTMQHGIQDQTNRSSPIMEMDMYIDMGIVADKTKAYYKDGYIYYDPSQTMKKQKQPLTQAQIDELNAQSLQVKPNELARDVSAYYLEHELYKTKITFTLDGEGVTKRSAGLLELLKKLFLLPFFNVKYGDVRLTAYLDANDDVKYITNVYEAELTSLGQKFKAYYETSVEILSIDTARVRLPDDLESYPDKENPSLNDLFSIFF